MLLKFSLASSSGSGMLLNPVSTDDKIWVVKAETEVMRDFGGPNQPHPPPELISSLGSSATFAYFKWREKNTD